MESVPDCYTSLRELINALAMMLEQHEQSMSSNKSLAQHSNELIQAYKQAMTPLAPSTATSSSAAGFDKLSTTESGPTTPIPEKKDLKPESDAAGENKTLIVTESLRHTSLRRTFGPCYGTCPQDVPLELGTTYTTIDRRMLSPWTVRYRANVVGHLNSMRLQDQIISAVLSRVKEVVPDEVGRTARPGVIFDADDDEKPTSRKRACLDLLCGTAEVFMAVRACLTTIEVEPVKGERVVYSQHRWSNSLPGYLFPIDILRLPQGSALKYEFFTALKSMVSRVGEALGVGHVMLADERGLTGITRAYVKLSPDAMRLNLSEMVALLPTRLIYDGSGYTLRYTGCSLNEKRIDSRN